LDEDTFLELTKIQKKKISLVVSGNSSREGGEQQIPGQISMFEGGNE
jgi:hypothetical protein